MPLPPCPPTFMAMWLMSSFLPSGAVTVNCTYWLGESSSAFTHAPPSLVLTIRPFWLLLPYFTIPSTFASAAVALPSTTALSLLVSAHVAVKGTPPPNSMAFIVTLATVVLSPSIAVTVPLNTPAAVAATLAYKVLMSVPLS